MAQERTLVMVERIRHDGGHRLQRAYQRLWQWAMANEASVERKECNHASSGVVRSGIQPASGERRDHRESEVRPRVSSIIIPQIPENSEEVSWRFSQQRP